MIPIVTGTPGYVAYGVMFRDDRVVSMSAWESEEHAKSADAALAEWVQTNTTMQVQSRYRRFLLARARPTVACRSLESLTYR